MPYPWRVMTTPASPTSRRRATLGCAITEFPTTSEAAIAAHAFGLKVLMGAPNLIRGGSHSGNVAAADLARYGKLDMFASDYIPSSMLAAAFKLTEPPFSWPLPSAIRTVTQAPAEAAGLERSRRDLARPRRRPCPGTPDRRPADRQGRLARGRPQVLSERKHIAEAGGCLRLKNVHSRPVITLLPGLA